MEMKDEIDEEEMALEDFVDKKMTDWDLPLVERTYFLASDCLSDKKNKRPLMEEVCDAITVGSSLVYGTVSTGMQ